MVADFFRNLARKFTHITFGQFVAVSAGILVIALIVSPAYYFYQKYTDLQKVLKNPAQVEKNKNEDLIKHIGTLVDLPAGETPNVMTIANIDRLKHLPFFEKAANGDKVLMYEKARKAFLYRPSTSRVVNIAPILSTQEVQSNIENIATSSPVPTTTQENTGLSTE